MTPQRLLALREHADPLADAACEALARQTDTPAGTLFEQLERAAARAADCRALLDTAQAVPDWVDRSRLQQGADVFLRDYRTGLARILLGTLPLSYTSGTGARVLVGTGNLLHSARRRLLETAQFVLDLMRSPGCLPGSPGQRAVVGVRLRHAFVRRSLRASGRWDEARDGPPINQLDTAFIGAAFCQIVLDGLRVLRPLADADADAYQHLWRYANWMIGVPPEVLADGAAAEAALLAQMRTLISYPTEDSRQLTRALHHAFAWRPPFTGIPPGLLQTITRFMVGNESADALGLPRHPLYRRYLRVMRARERRRGRRHPEPRRSAQQALVEMESMLREGLRRG